MPCLACSQKGLNSLGQGAVPAKVAAKLAAKLTLGNVAEGHVEQRAGQEDLDLEHGKQGKDQADKFQGEVGEGHVGKFEF